PTWNRSSRPSRIDDARLKARATLRPQAPPTAHTRAVSIDRVTDAELVDRARQGDPAAFGELVGRHQAAVYRAALAALGSPADAEDAAQDAFVTAFRRLDGFRGDASFKTWLLTIAWHQAINRRRSLSRWLRQFVSSDAFEPCDAPDGLSGGGTPEELAMGA